MPFNSPEFLFLFLPVTLLLYYGVFARRGATRQLFLASLTLIFYAIGGPKSVPLLLLSIAVNYAASLAIVRKAEGPQLARWALVLAILFDLSLLGYFKYMNFFLSNAEALGFHFSLASIALPLGISFFTFVQIGFLVDLSRGRFKAGGVVDYLSFVLFFPQLLAGPIVRYDETVPQLRAAPGRGLVATNILIGLSIFALGLFKKAVIADGIGGYSVPVFEVAAHGGLPGLVDAWVAAFSYTAQIYFDFAGYSDMAIGVARMLGVVLPLNFHSPLRSASIIEIWRRWHVTLSRWVQSYVFQPLSIPLARLAADRAPGKVGTFLLSFVLPTMTAMVVIGFWHGAGWTFILFGVMQGCFMVINDLWTKSRRKKRKVSKRPSPAYAEPLAKAVTLVAFVVSVVLFRAPDLATAGRIYGAMVGWGGWVDGAVAAEKWAWGTGGALAAVLITYAIIYLLPNTQQFMARANPVLEWAKWSKIDSPAIPIDWRPAAVWAILLAMMLFAGFVMMMSSTTNFIYFNF